VRVVFVALLMANGLGALLYIAFWAVLPGKPRTDPEKPRRRRGNGLQRVALTALVLGVIILQTQVHIFNVDGALVALTAVVALGAGIIWHQAEPQRRRRSTEDGRRQAGRDAGRTGRGARGGRPALVLRAGHRRRPAHDHWIIGILGFFAPGERNLSATVTGMAFALLALAGLVVALAPVLWRIVGQLREERVARIREQERAEVAAVVHDQVLHTLALIQRNAADSTRVLRLARGQERTPAQLALQADRVAQRALRGRAGAGGGRGRGHVRDRGGDGRVGDADHDDRVAALVAATREALVNAARHAKVTTVSLYAEAEDEALTVFVRDRGAASICPKWTMTGTACGGRSSAGCSVTAVGRRCARRRARGPRSN
jgi:signal transduction histidine kinase